MKYLSACHTDIGISRSVNQDSLFLKEAVTSHGRILFAVLCDGMGGMEKGEVASAMASEECAKWFSEQFPKQLFPFSVQRTMESLKVLFCEINSKIHQYGTENHINLGTTLTMFLLIDGECFLIGHIGDTRVYRIKRRVSVLTRDHTFVEREVRRGTMTKEEADQDPRRNLLLQCLGTGEEISPQFLAGEPEADCTYMLCSDGFRHKVSEEEFHQYLDPENLKDEDTIQRQAVRLVELNKERREKDNISTIIICTKQQGEERGREGAI